MVLTQIRLDSAVANVATEIAPQSEQPADMKANST